MQIEFIGKQKKKHGFMLFSAVLSTIVFMMLAGAFFAMYGGQFSLIQNGRTAIQAQQYAEIDANTLRLSSYADLDTKAHARQSITSIANAAGWEDEISIGAEQTLNEDSNNKQRIATVNIYKQGDIQSRYTLQLPLSSQGSGSSVPSGTILLWSGSIDSIPSGYHLCDGTNSTPDLRNKFILGAGNTYAVATTGGETTHKLTIEEMPSHNHSLIEGINVRVVNGYAFSNGCSFGQSSDTAGPKLDTIANAISIGYTGGNQPHNIMPPYYALAYIMKL